MADWRERTERMLGAEAVARLARARVALFGVGGVGSFAGEALIRAGIGAIDLFDDDVVSPTNLNRQLVALRSTLGRPKVDVMRERMLDINPDARVVARRMFYLPENADSVDLTAYDYVVDCVDTVAAKVELAVRCEALNVPLVASMGTGNKLDPTAFEVADIYSTSVCPLARAMRGILRKRGVRALKVVYSREEPCARAAGGEAPGSISFCPSVAGLILAGVVTRGLCSRDPRQRG